MVCALAEQSLCAGPGPGQEPKEAEQSCENPTPARGLEPFPGSAKGINEIFNVCLTSLIPPWQQESPAHAASQSLVLEPLRPSSLMSAQTAEPKPSPAGFWALLGWIPRADKYIPVLLGFLCVRMNFSR